MNSKRKSCFNLLKCLTQCSKERNKFSIKLAADTYESLSPQERDIANQDLYGTNRPIKETTEFVKGKLEELDNELALINEERKKYYTKALQLEQELLNNNEKEAGGGSKQDEKKQQEEEYIGSSTFRLMFLRAELFDAASAATRLTMYFKHKYDMFGQEALPLRIKQAHLNEEEKRALNKGVFLYAGGKDVMGRPILIGRRSVAFDYHVSCLERLAFYVFHKIVEENEVAQKRGIVLIGYNMGASLPNPLEGRRHFRVINMIVRALPIRIACLHNFYQDLNEHLSMNLVLVILPKRYRARFLAHFSKHHLECMYKIRNYGINPGDIPMTEIGEYRYELIRTYWEKQRQSEE